MILDFVTFVSHCVYIICDIVDIVDCTCTKKFIILHRGFGSWILDLDYSILLFCSLAPAVDTGTKTLWIILWIIVFDTFETIPVTCNLFEPVKDLSLTDLLQLVYYTIEYHLQYTTNSHGPLNITKTNI